MKDFMNKEERQLLSEKLFMNEKCDVTEFIKEIDRRLLFKREAYEEFLTQFREGFVNSKELNKALEETKELCTLRILCTTAYKKQKSLIGLMLIEYGGILKDILPEEED